MSTANRAPAAGHEPEERCHGAPAGCWCSGPVVMPDDERPEPAAARDRCRRLVGYMHGVRLARAGWGGGAR